ncbi:hypothetical protein [Parablautia muri]|nr:hypothetical protein [Parablautia muri]
MKYFVLDYTVIGVESQLLLYAYSQNRYNKVVSIKSSIEKAVKGWQQIWV